jgi:sigma-B regulation protein RsbU (phosphoserine phosphatase)
MDSIFYLGAPDEKLPRFLEKLGYAVFEASAGRCIDEIIFKTNIDIIVLDARVISESLDVCTFLRGQDQYRQLPIVYITGEDQPDVEEVKALDKIEIVSSPSSIGTVASRIATQLRLRKFAGQDDLKGSLAEVNAALRDYNLRFKKELQEAREIQEGLLPKALPKAPGMQLAVSYKPLDEVGGDWYFADIDAQGRVSLQIADVTGHGLSAAFIASMVKLASVAAPGGNPAQLLEGMNSLLSQQMPSGRFVTMASCLYEPTTGKLQWARAGHPPALVKRAATGVVEQLVGDGFPIGFMESAEYSLIECELMPGDSLLMFTDGLSEARSRSGDTFGLERLTSVLHEVSPQAGPVAILTAILDAWDIFREERLVKDDVTLLLLRRV